LPETSRNVEEIKFKKETNEKIGIIEKEINEIRTRIRQLNK